MSAPPPPTTGRRAILALLVVQLLFGAFPVIGKFAMVGFGAGGVSAARIIGAAVVFQVARIVMRLPGPPPREWPAFFLCALLGIASNQLLFLYGLARTSATHAALLVTTVPVFTVLTALLAGKETLRPRRALGIVVALAGAVWLITGRDPTGTSSVIGDLMVLANAVVYAIYLVVSRDLLSRWPPLVAVATFFVMAIPIVLPVTGLPSFGAADGTAWAALTFCVLGPTIGTYFLNLFALRAVPSSVVAIYIYLQPFVTSILAAALLGEGVTPRVLTAGLLSFVGVFLATRG